MVDTGNPCAKPRTSLTRILSTTLWIRNSDVGLRILTGSIFHLYYSGYLNTEYSNGQMMFNRQMVLDQMPFEYRMSEYWCVQ